MPKLSVFNSITLDGYFTGEDGDLGWAHQAGKDPEFEQFVSGNAQSAESGGVLLFGRKTYEMMIAYWPTPQAMKNDAQVAEGMNKASKVVFSKSLKKADWSNTRLISTDPVAAVRDMKQNGSEDMVILGSGSIVAQLAPTGLIDTYTLVVVPVALGAGRTMFEGVPKPLKLRQTGSRSFKNGNVVLNYEAERA